MENKQIMSSEKLGVYGILKQSFKIPYNNPKLVLITFLTSIPLIFTMVIHEIVLQTTMLETKLFLTVSPPPPPQDSFFDGSIYMSILYVEETPLETMIRFFQEVSPGAFQLGFLYFVPLHLLDLINTIATVNSVSAIYAEKGPVSIKEMLLAPFQVKRFKGPLITSVYVLALNSFVLSGLLWGATNSIFSTFGAFFMVIYGIFSIGLLVKWIEWTAIWNMSIVFSVLEEGHGLNALDASGYFSRWNKRRGLYLMLVFFAWRIALRLSSLYVGGNEKWSALAATSVLSCAGNVMKWIVCTVYFYDCKQRVMEKKVDVEEGTKSNIAAVVSV